LLWCDYVVVNLFNLVGNGGLFIIFLFGLNLWVCCYVICFIVCVTLRGYDRFKLSVLYEYMLVLGWAISSGDAHFFFIIYVFHLSGCY
jgi:hypothetical protein